MHGTVEKNTSPSPYNETKREAGQESPTNRLALPSNRKDPEL